MKFNPPPNWPQPPAGWRPPPGWQPDPSWPAPPAGWPLWVEEGRTFVLTRPGMPTQPGAPTQPGTAAFGPQQRSRWYLRTVAVVAFLLFCFPVGLVLSWLRTDWSLRRRGAITAVVAIVAVIAGTTSSPPPAATVQLGSPAGRASTLLPPGTPAPASRPLASISGGASPKPATSSAAATTARTASAAVATSASVAPPPPPRTTAATTRAAAPPAPSTQPPTTPAPQAPTCGAPQNPFGYNFCGDGGYVNDPDSDVCSYFDCIENFWHGRGYMVECNDGMYSMSGGIRGACSDHGGEDRPVYGG
jgi:hypothetical protein